MATMVQRTCQNATLYSLLVLLGKRKTILTQAWTGPEGSRRLRFPDFETLGTWRWQGCQPYGPAAFTTHLPQAGHRARMGPEGLTQ